MTTTKNINFRKIAGNEPEWLYKLRKDSWESYRNSPLPDQVVHLWRYTKPEKFVIDNPDKLMKAGLERSSVSAVNPDGTEIFKLSPELVNDGVRFVDLNTAVEENDGLVQEYLGKLVDSSFGKFEALNLALWNTGYMLLIPNNVVIEKPIYLNRVIDDIDTASRLLVVAGKNSQATLIDNYSDFGNGNSNQSSSVVEIFAEKHARMRYVNLQNFSNNISNYVTQRGLVKQEADLLTVQAILGSGLSKVNVGTILDERGANSRIYGILFGDNDQHFDLHTLHNHRSHESYSNIDVKVVLKNTAVSAYTGLIRIEENTINNQAYQENRNLLLNKGPKAESIPELEILSDEVRCSHGATMGPVDPEMIFYLKSRGIDYDAAVRMIVSGFFEPTLAELPDDLHDSVRQIVDHKLGEK